MDRFAGRVKLQFFAAIVLLILIFLFANQGFRTMMQNRRGLKKLEAEITELKEQNALLQKQFALAKYDLPYLERVARKELGLIKPGEIEYRFVDKRENTR